MKVKKGKWKSWLKTQLWKNWDHGIWSHHFMTNRRGNTGNSDPLFFLSSNITAEGDFSHEIKRRLFLGRKAMTNLDSILKSRHYLADKGPYIQSYGFSSSPVWMWELDHKESWALKNWCFWTVLLEKTLESPLDCKGIQRVNPKGDQSWIFIGRTDAEGPVLWPPDEKNWLLRTDPDARKDWRQEKEKVMTEHEMVGWTRVWASSRSWWWTGRPGMLQSMGLQRVGHDWLSDWTELMST